MALNLKKRDLRKYDIEAHTDISGSMDTRDSSTGGVTRYQHAAGWVGTLVEECERYDDDGVTVGFFNDGLQIFPNTTFAKVADKFKRVRPGGTTDTAGLIQARVSDYLDARLGTPAVKGTKGGLFGRGTPDIPAKPGNPNIKPRILIVITDGKPNSQTDLQNVIVGATKRMSKGGLTKDDLVISFIQVGNDSDAKVFLERLNTGLTEATMDIVGCITCDQARGLTTEQLLEKALDAE